MRALQTTGTGRLGLELGETPAPEPSSNQAVVAVRAVSLNRGEVRRLAGAPAGFVPGWDVAGVVTKPARNGTGPAEGTRVVGLVPSGAWAEQAAIDTAVLAPLPDDVSFEAASTLPVAGLTALRALAVGGFLLGARVLVTGAAGGVGRFAVQLAGLAGANVVAIVGSAERATGLMALGAAEVIIGEDEPGHDFDLILESVGGESLSRSLAAVARSGTVVHFGSSSGEAATIEPTWYGEHTGARLYGLRVFDELLRSQSGVRDLSLLARLVADGRLDPQVSQTLSWRDPTPALEALMARKINGKAVLTID